ncbi:lipoate--protein ligase family protein [bacterium]|nr:lipoate--protein ligase family protein [bacterium]
MPLRLLFHPEASPARNMAIDEALLRHAKAPVLRLYSWDQPCVSIGYFQKAAVAPSDRPMVRRYTGGGLVEHGRDLTYTLVLPSDHPLTTAGTLPSYRSIHQAVAQALQDCGIKCLLATNSDGLKLAGAAQRRTKQGCLHQGSILLPYPIPPQLGQLLTQSLSSCLAQEAVPSALTREEHLEADSLETRRYATRDWNFSR